MLSFDSIDRRSYRFVMLMAFAFLVILTANIEKILQLALYVVDCNEWGSLCPILEYNVLDYFSILAVSLFMLVVAVATLRRVTATPISNYWVVFLTLLIFLDHQYLTGFGTLWRGNFLAGLFQFSAPWFMMAAVSLILLLSFAPDRSTYFMQGYWNADPPLGWALSVSSFWLLVLSSPKVLIIVADAIGNYPLGLTAAEVQQKMEQTLPIYVTSPVLPTIVFSTCVLLLLVLGRFSGNAGNESIDSTNYRLQNAVHTTKAAQSLNGLKL